MGFLCMHISLSVCLRECVCVCVCVCVLATIHLVHIIECKSEVPASQDQPIFGLGCFPDPSQCQNP